MNKQILNEIKKHKTIIIHRHQKPDGDALGSQLGLKEILIKKFPDKNIIAVGNRKEFDKHSIKNIFKDNFDKVTINDYKGSLVIVVDTANIERIQGEEFFRGETIIKIDHHKTSENFGNIEWIESNTSSVSEMIARFARQSKMEITKKAAEYLLTGIITDTGKFMFNSVKAETFEEAMYLSKAGVKISKIANALNDRNINFIRLQGKIMSDLNFSKGVSYYMMPKGLHKKYSIDYNTASSLIFILMGFSEANYALYATYDSKNGHYKASLRSRKKPIVQIAEEHNGGGHEMAAGLKIKNKKEFEEVLSKLKLL
ncbi:MAG: bifunctional oligoribonuclease/PAP phosphatase NrnA [Mycoplasmataceae bacterium]|nr:bifunctional oligoribonuclease/PAP phosphatase NrnA [Mycoplasmataceae bacterium]